MNYEFGEFFVFQISDILLGLSMDSVEEVVARTQITPIARTATFVSGLAAVRGKIMSVIDGGMRLGIPSNTSNYFIITYVRGNQTAISIERPIEAGSICARKLASDEFAQLLVNHNLQPKLFKGGWQIFEKGENDEWVATPRMFLEIVADQFVSDQMASQLLRA